MVRELIARDRGFLVASQAARTCSGVSKCVGNWPADAANCLIEGAMSGSSKSLSWAIVSVKVIS